MTGFSGGMLNAVHASGLRHGVPFPMIAEAGGEQSLTKWQELLSDTNRVENKRTGTVA